MPETDDVEKLLAEEKAIGDRRKALIAELLKRREAQNKDIDDQLAKLGHHATGKSRRNHHAKAAAAAEPKPKTKP